MHLFSTGNEPHGHGQRENVFPGLYGTKNFVHVLSMVDVISVIQVLSDAGVNAAFLGPTVNSR